MGPLALAPRAGTAQTERMRTLRRPRGQSSVEYLLLLTSVLVVIQIVGLTLSKYGRDLTERVLDRMETAAIALASPY